MHLISTVVCQMSALYCGEGGLEIFLYTQMSIKCFECAITEIYLSLVARNLLKYVLLFFFFLETYRLIGR
jgi:hypothetical protein